MNAQPKSFVKAAIEFFGNPPFGRKLGIPEFKDLTTTDKVELSTMLNAVPGYEHTLYTGESSV
jgi:hypothetical protein